MKKILAIMLVAALALALVACGGTPASSGSTASTADSGSTAASGTATDLTFGYIAYDMSDIWNEYSAYAFEYAAEQNGDEVIVLDSQNDIAQSISAMESLIQPEVDGISIFPISPEQGAQLVTMANEAGIPITVENIDVADVCEPDSYVAAVGCVYGDIGYAAIEWLAQNIEDAKVFYCAGAVGGGVYEAYKVGVDQRSGRLRRFQSKWSACSTPTRLVHRGRPEP